MTQTFTKTQLAQYTQYNGKIKPQKYVDIDGIVYDVTQVDAWAGANHHGQVASNDLSGIILKAPHKKTVLAKLPVVGKLTE